MTRLNSVVSAALLVGVVLSSAVSAHHSVQAQYAPEGQKVTVAGTLAKLEFLNPHSYLTLNVKDADGKIVKWAFELGAAANLRGRGLSRADQGGLKVGEQLTATALPARNGSNSGYLLQIERADGRVMKFGIE
jgi:hypothetical protein